MISVKKDFDNPPAILIDAKPNAWKHPSVLAELKLLYHGKCAYCETKTKDLVIDHFRPVYSYDYLANEWSNLLPACIECHNTKGGRFPIEGNYQKISPLPENEKSFKANSEFLLSEKPLLIHPEVDTAENHFHFDKNGLMYGYTQRGKETVSLLNLNRLDLISKRKDIYERYFNELKENIEHEEPQYKNYFYKLKEEILPKNEASLFVQQIYYDFNDFIFEDIVSEIIEDKSEEFEDEEGDENDFEDEYDYDDFLEELEDEIREKSKSELDLYYKIIYGIDDLETKIDTPFSLIDFSILKFQGINDLSVKNIPSNTQWIFLTGENGYGKTSILRAILLGLIGRHEFSDNEIDENTRIELKLIEKINFRINVFGSNHHRAYKQNIAAYGAIRTFLNPDRETPPISANLFANTTYVLNTESLLERLSGKKELEPFKNEIIDYLLQLIPNLSRIKVVANKDKNDTEILYYEKDNTGLELPPVRFKELAMGMKGIIGLIGDIIQRLTENKDSIQLKLSFNMKNYNSLLGLSGIVIIDEFDNHLHPKWQRMLVEKLTELFPKVQFIVSTHSPIPLLGAPKNSVILKVNRTKEEGITVEKLDIDISELPPENILSSPIFDFQDIIPKEYRRGTRLRTEKGYDEVEFYKILEEKMQSIANEAGVEYKTIKK